ncbi:hypothetical protein VNI00_016297 [Paramarasmius palmivorus]|uniref:Uncharacterized protein n=1 Tax=Paramarasmius palmivorus TaxID=297713 RepID=A0AAW0BDT8_9AGAR
MQHYLGRLIPISVWRSLLSTPSSRQQKHGVWWLLEMMRKALQCLARRAVGYRMYGNEEEEQKYWESVKGYRKRLQSYDACHGAGSCMWSEDAGVGRGRAVVEGDPMVDVQAEKRGQIIPLVRYYQPALPPEPSLKGQRRSGKRKRGSVEDVGYDGTDDEYYLSSKSFCKWHRMVNPPDSMHPTLAQATKLKENFSGCDRREMHRISRMLPSEVVYSPNWRWTPRYQNMWKAWLEQKGAEFLVVFEEE